MSKTKKIWLITAIFLVTAGLLIFAGAMAAFGFDFSRLSTVEYKTNSYEVSGDFNKISIDVTTAEIVFAASDDESCKVISYEPEKLKHTATVENGTLVINTVDTRKWYDYIGISLGNTKITVYLPKNEYTALEIDTNTGDIYIPEVFTFENIEITGDTAKVTCYASASDILKIGTHTGDIRVDTLSAGEIRLSTATGDIDINSVTSEDNINIETDTGEVNLTDVNCKSISAESSTGDITFKRVIAADLFTVKTGTGNVRFENSDAASISVKTSTGNVTGILLSEKVFITETSTGDINVPKTITGGRCEITTSTGDIKIDIR